MGCQFLAVGLEANSTFSLSLSFLGDRSEKRCNTYFKVCDIQRDHAYHILKSAYVNNVLNIYHLLVLG